MDESRYLEYLDFDLRFCKDTANYRAEIVGVPAGAAQHVFHFPFQEHELENYLLKIGQRRSGMRKVDSPENRAARGFGNKLFETVFQRHVRSAFYQSIETARASHKVYASGFIWGRPRSWPICHGNTSTSRSGVSSSPSLLRHRSSVTSIWRKQSSRSRSRRRYVYWSCFRILPMWSDRGTDDALQLEEILAEAGVRMAIRAQHKP